MLKTRNIVQQVPAGADISPGSVSDLRSLLTSRKSLREIRTGDCADVTLSRSCGTRSQALGGITGASPRGVSRDRLRVKTMRACFKYNTLRVTRKLSTWYMYMQQSSWIEQWAVFTCVHVHVGVRAKNLRQKWVKKAYWAIICTPSATVNCRQIVG